MMIIRVIVAGQKKQFAKINMAFEFLKPRISALIIQLEIEFTEIARECDL